MIPRAERLNRLQTLAQRAWRGVDRDRLRRELAQTLVGILIRLLLKGARRRLP